MHAQTQTTIGHTSSCVSYGDLSLTDWLLTGKGQAFQSQSSEDAPKENLINRVTTAIFQGEIPKALGEDIIRELMEYRDNDASQKEQINALNTRIIKMLDVARKYSE